MADLKSYSNIQLDFGMTRHRVTIEARQGDQHTRYVRACAICHGAQLTLEGITARAEYKQANGKGSIVDCEVETEGYVVLELTDLMLSVPGVMSVTMVLYKDGAFLTSQDFDVRVRPRLVDDETPLPDVPEMSVNQALAAMDVARAAAEEATAAATTATAKAEEALTEAEEATTKAEEAIAKAEEAFEEATSLALIRVVESLPDTGEANAFYLVPKADAQTQDFYDEWVWVNKGTDEAPDWCWEWITTKQIEVDLTPYATKEELQQLEAVMEPLYCTNGNCRPAAVRDALALGRQVVMTVTAMNHNGEQFVVVLNNFIYDASMDEVRAFTAMVPSNIAGEYKVSIFGSPAGGDNWFIVTDAQLTAVGILQRAYPVGSVYMSFEDINPAELFGFGTWEQLGGQFLLGANDTYTVGSTGGEATHTLTQEEMPIHVHNISSSLMWANQTGQVAGGQNTYYQRSGEQTTQIAGGDQPHNNMPPYIAVYMWRRTE